MNKIYLLILLLIFSFSLTAQTNSKSDEELVKQLIRDVFEDIYTDFKTEKLKVHHTDDFLLLENGDVWNNDSLVNYHIKRLKNPSDVKRINEIDFIQVEKRSKNIIWVAYHNYAHWTREEKHLGKTEWSESALAIKTKKGWKLQLLHSTWVKNEQ